MATTTTEVWVRCDACGIACWNVPGTKCCCGGTLRQPPKGAA